MNSTKVIQIHLSDKEWLAAEITERGLLMRAKTRDISFHGLAAGTLECHLAEIPLEAARKLRDFLSYALAECEKPVEQ